MTFLDRCRCRPFVHSSCPVGSVHHRAGVSSRLNRGLASIAGRPACRRSRLSGRASLELESVADRAAQPGGRSRHRGARQGHRRDAALLAPVARVFDPDKQALRAAVEQQPMCVDEDTVIICSSTRQLIPAMAHFPAHRREKLMISTVPFSPKGRRQTPKRRAYVRVYVASSDA
jgi:hypothetical protein